ncbi:MAG: thioredoxin [Lachnospiraceae bacterium]|nr:thioredoxin [Lachnospiraceae bacterium]
MRTIRIFLLAAAIVLLLAGIFNGSARDVFGKAVKICTECVGLG